MLFDYREAAPIYSTSIRTSVAAVTSIIVCPQWPTLYRDLVGLHESQHRSNAEDPAMNDKLENTFLYST